MTAMKAAAYCRVSTDRLDQANSFESQQCFFKEYIERQPDWELFKVYADEGISGTSTKKRDAFNQMIADAKRSCFEIIITKEVSRFSRNILDTVYYTRELRQKGIGVIFLNDGINTLEPDSELRLSIMGSIAQEESRKTSSRVKWGQTRRMESGVVFGTGMLGYDVENGSMRINPEGAEIVTVIFHKYANERKGTTVIARELRQAGYKTLKGNAVWSNSSILKILRNEKYCGDLCQKKTYTPDYLSHIKKYNNGAEEKIYIKNHHEPIIERELWNKAQEEIERRSTKSGAKNGHGNKYPLSGKIFCAECGSAFSARHKKRKDGSIYRYWRCGKASAQGARVYASGCNIGRQISDEICMRIIKQVVESLNFDRDEVIKNIKETVAEIQGGCDNNRIRQEKQINALSDKKKRVLDAYFSEKINEIEMRMILDKYDDEIALISKRLMYNSQKGNQAYCAHDITQAVNNIVILNEQHDVFYGSLLEKAVVFSDGRVEVTLNFLPTKWIFSLN